ncbi:transcription initiation factor TFIID TATA-box-binding protein [Pseudoscourfieldia marina]
MSSAAPDLSLHPSGIVPNIDNVVAQFSLGCEVDLKQVTLHAKNCEYNPKRYPAVVSRIREPHSTACIFASGKVNVTGTKSEADAKRAATKFAKNVKKADYAASVNDFRVIWGSMLCNMSQSKLKRVELKEERSNGECRHACQHVQSMLRNI